MSRLRGTPERTPTKVCPKRGKGPWKFVLLWERCHAPSCRVLPIKAGSHCSEQRACSSWHRGSWQGAPWLPTPHRWARRQTRAPGARPSPNGRGGRRSGLKGPEGSRRWQGPNARRRDRERECGCGGGNTFWGAPGRSTASQRVERLPPSLNIHGRMVAMTGGSAEEDVSAKAREIQRGKGGEGANQTPVRARYKQTPRWTDRRHLCRSQGLWDMVQLAVTASTRRGIWQLASRWKLCADPFVWSISIKSRTLDRRRCSSYSEIVYIYLFI